MSRHETSVDEPSLPERRVLGLTSSLAMLAGLAGGYGLFALVSARFLFPARPALARRLFVARARDLGPGDSLRYETPEGRTVNITRQGTGDTAEDFIALSSTCPHLGCQVHWEPQNSRYFCPCHNGTFDPSGRGTGGPPGDAGQSLPRYALAVEQGILFIEVPEESLTVRAAGPRRPRAGRVVELAGPCGPGHDPCLTRLRATGSRRGEGAA
jgi:nitrite reductase/ring-hydroxylating ferredoxin subunit